MQRTEMQHGPDIARRNAAGPKARLRFRPWPFGHREIRPDLGFRQQAFALSAFAGELAGAADGLGLLARFFLRRLLEVIAPLHLPEETFALHLFLQRFQRLIDVVVAHDNLNDVTLS